MPWPPSSDPNLVQHRTHRVVKTIRTTVLASRTETNDTTYPLLPPTPAPHPSAVTEIFTRRWRIAAASDCSLSVSLCLLCNRCVLPQWPLCGQMGAMRVRSSRRVTTGRAKVHRIVLRLKRQGYSAKSRFLRRRLCRRSHGLINGLVHVDQKVGLRERQRRTRRRRQPRWGKRRKACTGTLCLGRQQARRVAK